MSIVTTTTTAVPTAPGVYEFPRDIQGRSQVAASIANGAAVRVDTGHYRVLGDDEAAAERAKIQAHRDRVRADEAAERERYRLRRCQWLWEQSGIPTLHRLADLNALGDVPPEYARVAGVLRELLATPKLVALVGTRGGGKTFLASALGREFARAGRSVRYVRTLDFFREVRRTWSAKRGEETEADLLDDLAAVDLLILDEVQDKAGSDWERGQFSNLIDRRYADLRPTLLLGNVAPNALAECVGESVASRLQTGVVVACTWPSFRATGTATVPSLRPGEWPPVMPGAVANSPRPYCPG